MNRFGVNFNDLNFKNKNGDVISGDINKYMNEIQKEITVSHKPKIGDIVKLKGVEYLVVVKFINYEIKGIGIVDYAGVKSNDDEEIVLFNQKDIESINSLESEKKR